MGNVFRGADFADMTYLDLVTSAVVIGPEMQEATNRPVGQTVLAAIEATQAAVATNTNLGTLLLLAPLAAVPRETSLSDGIGPLLDALDSADARDVYAAIRRAKPGGLGISEVSDVADEPNVSLREAMQLAAERDLVARQYADNFSLVFNEVAGPLNELLEEGLPLGEAIVRLQLDLLARHSDSLVIRKTGHKAGAELARRAQAVLTAGPWGSETSHRARGDLDFWLRSDGNRRNPGTTADLIAAGLFVLLREGRLRPPVAFYENEPPPL